MRKLWKNIVYLHMESSKQQLLRNLMAQQEQNCRQCVNNGGWWWQTKVIWPLSEFTNFNLIDSSFTQIHWWTMSFLSEWGLLPMDVSRFIHFNLYARVVNFHFRAWDCGPSQFRSDTSITAKTLRAWRGFKNIVTPCKQDGNILDKLPY